jgi:ubiquinone/menaquinone biosynthesis C-methylase UbiE
MKRLVAKDHREAYHYWAEHFDDPSLMSNRHPRITDFKVANIARQIPLASDSRVLDVGPGDGALLRLLAPRVERCCGVDPSPSAVRKLTGLFADLPNVEFAVGSSEAIPYPDNAFDVVVINSVILILPSRDAVDRTLAELVRVCRPGGTVFVGEVPFKDERRGGLPAYLARKVREVGAVRCAVHLYRVHLRPVLRGEPLLTFPAKSLHFESEDFMALCRRHGVRVECRPHLEPRRRSMTRNDYVLTRVPSPSP